jgi:hypothetical protein
MRKNQDVRDEGHVFCQFCLGEWEIATVEVNSPGCTFVNEYI